MHPRVRRRRGLEHPDSDARGRGCPGAPACAIRSTASRRTTASLVTMDREDHPEFRAASTLLLSAAYFHQGFVGSPSMKRTGAMNVSSKQGSWRLPVIRQRSLHIAYGSRPSNWAGDLMPNRRRSAAIAGPTLGMERRFLQLAQGPEITLAGSGPAPSPICSLRHCSRRSGNAKRDSLTVSRVLAITSSRHITPTLPSGMRRGSPCPFLETPRAGP